MTTKKFAPRKSVTEKPAGKRSPAAKNARKRPTQSMPAAGRDPKGGLTAEGRSFFNRETGSHLRPGVRGAADTPEKMKRKGSFLTRHFTNPRGPMLRDGKPTRLALSAHAWGEPVPKTEVAAKRLAAKGRKLLEQYHRVADTKSRVPRKVAAKKKSS